MTGRKAVWAVVAALIMVSAVAAPAQKESAPAGGTPKDFSLPDKQTFALDNGLQATLVAFGSLPKATVSVIVRSGNLNEGERTWLADLSSDFLLEGTTNRSAERIAREAASMGGQISVSVGEDQTTVSSDVLSEFAPAMAELLADVVQNPSFPETELERLKRDRLRQLSLAKTQPQQMALAAFRAAIYGEHPYGRLLPQEEQLANYTMKDVRSFYDENFGATRTRVYVAGMFDPDATRTAIERSFAAWEPGPDILIDPPEPARGRVAVGIIDRPGASQSDLYLGLATIDPSDPDWIALQVTNTLLGGFFSSRVTRNIREDKGYTYSPFSSLSARYRDAYWAQVAAVTTEVTAPAIEEIMGEIDRLQQTPPPKDELDGVKNYAAGVFVLQNSTREGIIGLLNFQDLHQLPDAYLGSYVSKVFSVTPDEVSETASRFLREEDMTLIVVGDRARVSEEVAPWLGKEQD